MRAFPALVGAVLALAAGNGCGYQLVRADALPAEVRSVRVEVTAPERTDPLLADSLARELRRALRTDGRFRVVEKGGADAELSVAITVDRTRVAAFNEFGEVLDYQRTVAVDGELRRGDEVLWSATRLAATRGQAAVEGAVVTSSSAFQGGDVVQRDALGTFDNVQLGEERRAAAREAVMRDLAETLVARMTEGI